MRERDIGQRIEREQAEAARRIQSTFADVERRQVEQLERVLERAAGRFADAAAQQFDNSIKTAREDAAQRLSRELDRSVQMFAREGESLLAERLAQVGDAGGLRLEKKLAQVSKALERQRDEFVAVTERRLSELDADFRARLSGLPPTRMRSARRSKRGCRSWRGGSTPRLREPKSVSPLCVREEFPVERTERPRDERRDPDCGARSERPRARRELAAAHPDRGGYPLPLAERLAQSEADLHRAVELVTQGCEPQTAAEILL